MFWSWNWKYVLEKPDLCNICFRQKLYHFEDSQTETNLQMRSQVYSSTAILSWPILKSKDKLRYILPETNYVWKLAKYSTKAALSSCKHSSALISILQGLGVGPGSATERWPSRKIARKWPFFLGEIKIT